MCVHRITNKKHTPAQLSFARSVAQGSTMLYRALWLPCRAVQCCAVLCRAFLCFLVTYQPRQDAHRVGESQLSSRTSCSIFFLPSFFHFFVLVPVYSSTSVCVYLVLECLQPYHEHSPAENQVGADQSTIKRSTWYVRTFMRRPGCFSGALSSWHWQVDCLHLKCWIIYYEQYICHSVAFSLSASAAGGSTSYSKRLVHTYLVVHTYLHALLYSCSVHTCLWYDAAPIRVATHLQIV